MKTLVILIALCFVGYWLHEYYEQSTNQASSIAHVQKGLVTTPIPSEEPTPTRVPDPDLDSILVKGQATLTHAKIKEIHTDSILFVCDQGLAEVAFDKLPPEFRTRYAPPVSSPSPTPTGDIPATQPPATVAATPTPRPPVRQRSIEEEAAARVAYQERKSALEAHQQEDLVIINRWYKQSTFDPDAISQSTFDWVKADYDSTTAQLNQLEATGP
jgi:hypothetical protein